MDTLGLGLVVVIGLLLVRESGVPVPVPACLVLGAADLSAGRSASAG